MPLHLGHLTNGAFSVFFEQGTGVGSGEIQIEANTWQLISIPVRYGYWDMSQHKLVHDGVTVARIKNYFFDQIEDKYGDPANFIEIANTFFGDEGYYRAYIPGVTNPNSDNNFPLAYVDGARVEYTGFWVKSISSSDIVIEWGE